MSRHKNLKSKRKSTVHKSDKEKIKELSAENINLRREINELKNEIERSKPSTRRILRKKDNISKLLAVQTRKENTFSQEAYWAYFMRSLKNASLFRIYADIVNTVKHFTFVTTTIKIVLFLLSLVKSGAIILISTSAFIVSLPFILLISCTGAILTFLGERKANKTNLPIIKGKKVYVFFPAKRSAMNPESYFAGFVKSIAKNDNTVCVIVTPGFFFSKGICSKNNYFFTSRLDTQNIITLRRRYYFKFKNRILLSEASSICEIY